MLGPMLSSCSDAWHLWEDVNYLIKCLTKSMISGSKSPKLENCWISWNQALGKCNLPFQIPSQKRWSGVWNINHREFMKFDFPTTLGWWVLQIVAVRKKESEGRTSDSVQLHAGFIRGLSQLIYPFGCSYSQFTRCWYIHLIFVDGSGRAFGQFGPNVVREMQRTRT